MTSTTGWMTRSQEYWSASARAARALFSSRHTAQDIFQEIDDPWRSEAVAARVYRDGVERTVVQLRKHSRFDCFARVAHDVNQPRREHLGALG